MGIKFRKPSSVNTRFIIAFAVAGVCFLAILQFSALGSYLNYELTAPLNSLSGIPVKQLQNWVSREVTAVSVANANRCMFTKSGWCDQYLAAGNITWKPPPIPTKRCVQGCNFVGVCDAHAGWCRCPAGWTGDACEQRMKRPCSQVHAAFGFEPYDKPINWDIRGLKVRCAGECDDDIAMCYCPSNTTYGRIPADEFAPPGTPPKAIGRPLGDYCQPNKTPWGTETPFGDIDPDKLYGLKGWCQAAIPELKCPCHLDGLRGEFCDIPTEHTCMNQCSGHGECYLGWCKCHEGFFGQDCAYRMPGVQWTAGLEQERPWLANHVATPAAHDPPPALTRHRPLIYVYELPPIYNQLLLQYRLLTNPCMHRIFGDHNITEINSGWLYNIEPGIHEMLLQSPHRTLDPEEADFFYVPIYSACLTYPVLGTADFPWFHGQKVPKRSQTVTNVMLDAWQWLRSHHPYWDRNGGKDHIFLAPHDEATCYMPAAIRPAIILGMWGRTDLNHTSGTAYGGDMYSEEHTHPVWHPESYQEKLGNFSCYEPDKDIILPVMFSPQKYKESPLFGAPDTERYIFAFFKGELRAHDTVYSRGIRQTLANMTRDSGWWAKHRVWIGDKEPPERDGVSYGALLSSSIFCFVLPGDGWSSRFEDSIVHGCIPVVIMDNVDPSFSSALEVEAFSIRIAQKDLARIPEILKAINSEEVLALQKNVRAVWHRYVYTGYKPYREVINTLLKERQDRLAQPRTGGNSTAGDDPLNARSNLGAAYQKDYTQDDAFETLLQVLHGKMIRK